MRASVVVLALCMLLTGTINTIATKYQDIIVIGYEPDGTPITFRHPAVQSACMFLGESLCLIPYFIMRWRRRKAKRRDPAYVPMAAEEKRSRRIRRILAFAVPTLCDATGTSLMNIGLFYTYASTYQMLRGTLVLFAGAFTVLILRRQLFIHHWLGMVLITAGAALVGASSVLYQNPSGSSSNTTSLAHWPHQPAWQTAGPGGLDSMPNATAASGLHYAPGVSRVASRGMLDLTGLPGLGTSGSSSSGSSGGDVLVDPFGAGSGLRPGVVPGLHVWSAALHEGPDVAAAPLFGDLLVVGAQMFTALQFILEEKFLVKYKVPALLAVGLEGCWGLFLCSFLLPVTSIIRGPDGLPLDDAAAAFRAIWSNIELGGAVYLSIFSIAFFNFFGVSVTKSLSGAARATIDACRTVFIWLYALHAGWESFHALEVVGFIVLISGTSLYNEIIKSCLPGTTVDRGRQTPLPRHGRRSRSSGAVRESSTGADAALTTPLLQVEADKEPAIGTVARVVSPPAGGGGGAAAAEVVPAGRGSRAPPVPLLRQAPAHTRAAEAAQSTGASGSWAYHMARSMRLGIHTLSPQSLAAAGGLASGASDEEGGSDGDGEDSVSESGSSYRSSYLASSLGRSMEGSAGGLASTLTGRGPSGGGSRGGILATYADGAPSSSSSSGMRVLRGFEGPGALTGFGSGVARPAAGAGVGGLTASLQAAAGGTAGGNGSRLRSASPATGMPPLPREPSSGSLRRQSSSGNVRSQQQQQQQ